MEKAKSQFSKNLIKLRNSKGISQEQLASKLFLTRQSISKWENNESVPDLNNLLQLSKILDISIDELVLGKDPTNSKKIIKNKISSLLKQDESDKDWHNNHRWREWRYSKVNNGWEWLARYYWVLFGLVGFIGWLIFKFYGKSF